MGLLSSFLSLVFRLQNESRTISRHFLLYKCWMGIQTQCKPKLIAFNWIVSGTKKWVHLTSIAAAAFKRQILRKSNSSCELRKKVPTIPTKTCLIILLKCSTLRGAVLLRFRTEHCNCTQNFVIIFYCKFQCSQCQVLCKCRFVLRGAFACVPCICWGNSSANVNFSIIWLIQMKTEPKNELNE